MKSRKTYAITFFVTAMTAFVVMLFVGISEFIKNGFDLTTNASTLRSLYWIFILFAIAVLTVLFVIELSVIRDAKLITEGSVSKALITGFIEGAGTAIVYGVTVCILLLDVLKI